MIAVVGGLGAAVCWAVATIVSSRSSRLIGASSVLGWVMVVGALVSVGPALLSRPAGIVDPAALLLAVLAGIGYVSGLYLNYRALRIGQVGIVAPIASTEGAIAAVIAVALGEPLGTVAAMMLCVVVLGVVLASMAPAPARDTRAGASDATPSAGTTAHFALAAAVMFAVGLVASARAVTLGMPVLWVALVARLIGMAGVTIPLIVSSRLHLSRQAAPLAVIGGIVEVVGTSVYTIGAQGGIAVAAVIGSQFATIAAIAAYFLFGERLGRLQLTGVGLVVTGVAVLAAMTN